jgi:hypothetical protein
MPEPDYARIAFEAWCASHRGTHLNQQVIVSWESQPQAVKGAWQAAIDAAFNAQIPYLPLDGVPGQAEGER